MSLLCVTVKKADLQGPSSSFNTYVTLKLQNVKSTTVIVKGGSPCWEQDFMFEVSSDHRHLALVVELWNKGIFWDNLLGTAWIPLRSIPLVHASDATKARRWHSIDAELLMRDGEAVGTQKPTGHAVLLQAYFELSDDGASAEMALEREKRLEVLNSQQIAMDHLGIGVSHCFSEDSDYTSEAYGPIWQSEDAAAYYQECAAANRARMNRRSGDTFL